MAPDYRPTTILQLTSTKAVSSIYSLMVFSLLEEVALIKVGETEDDYCYGPQNGLVYI